MSTGHSEFRHFYLYAPKKMSKVRATLRLLYIVRILDSDAFEARFQAFGIISEVRNSGITPRKCNTVVSLNYVTTNQRVDE